MTDKEMTQKICRNVKYLCLIENVKIGDVEKAIGVSAGYFLRVYKVASDFSICKAYKIAQFFVIPIDHLINFDFRREYHEQKLKRIESEEEE